MRLYDYMKLSSNDDISTFKSLKIDIVKDDLYKDIVCELSKKYEYINKSLEIVDDINNTFKKYHKGSYKYGFCFESIKNIDDIVAKKRQIDKLYEKYNKTNDEFEKIKRRLENDLHNK